MASARGTHDVHLTYDAARMDPYAELTGRNATNALKAIADASAEELGRNVFALIDGLFQWKCIVDDSGSYAADVEKPEVLSDLTRLLKRVDVTVAEETARNFEPPEHFSESFTERYRRRVLKDVGYEANEPLPNLLAALARGLGVVAPDTFGFPAAFPIKSLRVWHFEKAVRHHLVAARKELLTGFEDDDVRAAEGVVNLVERLASAFEVTPNTEHYLKLYQELDGELSLLLPRVVKVRVDPDRRRNWVDRLIRIIAHDGVVPASLGPLMGALCGSRALAAEMLDVHPLPAKLRFRGVGFSLAETAGRVDEMAEHATAMLRKPGKADARTLAYRAIDVRGRVADVYVALDRKDDAIAWLKKHRVRSVEPKLRTLLIEAARYAEALERLDITPENAASIAADLGIEKERVVEIGKAQSKDQGVWIAYELQQGDTEDAEALLKKKFHPRDYAKIAVATSSTKVEAKILARALELTLKPSTVWLPDDDPKALAIELLRRQKELQHEKKQELRKRWEKRLAKIAEQTPHHDLRILAFDLQDELATWT